MSLSMRKPTRTNLSNKFKHALVELNPLSLWPSGFFWQVPRKKEGSYYLSATFSSVPAKEERRRAWKGTLVLPKVVLPPKAK